MLSRRCLLGLLLLAVVQQTTSLAVMSIDLGSEWMKVAIVSPGVPMEIVLNSDSQRKTPMVISFRDGERSVGDSAANIGVRFPQKAFSHFLHLVAKRHNSSAVRLFLERFPYHRLLERGDQLVLAHPEDLDFTPEELISQMLLRAKLFAQDASKQIINDAVITVPPFFGQAERRAVLSAAKLAGIKVLQLMNANAAFALNYGVFRWKDFNTTATNIVFYDQGASSTVVTVASYQLVKTKERGFVETNPQVTVKGVGFDSNLGGLEMQLRLRDHLAKVFAEQSKTPLVEVRGNHRAMAKLMKEAGRLKKVLSANSEHKAQVENVMNDKDLKTVVNRQEFEDLCADLFGDRLTKPIDEAMKSSGISSAEVDQVIVVGGNTRVPRVQQRLLDYFKTTELGKSVNADEAAALGAAYQAAHLSKGFKVKTFGVKDANLYPIVVDFWRTNDDGSTKTLSRTLFPRNNLIPQKKVLTFNKHTDDFDFEIHYGSPKPDDSSAVIGKAKLNGVAEALKKHTEETKEPKGIKVHFRMDESGLLGLETVEAVFESRVEESVPDEDEELGNVVGEAISKFGSTLSKLFGRGDADESANTTDDGKSDGNQTANNETDTKSGENATSGNETTSSPNNGTESVANKTQVKVKTIREPIAWSYQVLDVAELTDEQIKKSEEKLRNLDLKEKEKLVLDQAKNSLESFILETKFKLSQAEFEEAATESEKQELDKQLSAASEWLEYESDGAETRQFNDRLAQLKLASRDLFDRVRQHRERPEALAALNNMLNISQIFYSGAVNVSKDDQIFTDVELNTLGKLIGDTKSWVDQSVAEQAKLAKHETPKLTTKAIAEKISALDREVKYMLNKARVTPPKKKPDSEEKSKNKTDDKKDGDGEEKKDEEAGPESDEGKEAKKKEATDDGDSKVKTDETKPDDKDGSSNKSEPSADQAKASEETGDKKHSKKEEKSRDEEKTAKKDKDKKDKDKKEKDKAEKAKDKLKVSSTPSSGDGPSQSPPHSEL